MLLEVHDLFAALTVLFHRGCFQCVILLQHRSGSRRVADAVAGKGDAVRLHLHRSHPGNVDTGGHDGVEGSLPLGKIRGFGLGLDVHALALALLPQRERAGKGHVDMWVETQRMPHRQTAALEHPLHHPLQVQQGDIGGFIFLFKRDSDCNQSRDLLTDGWHRRRCRHGCRARWSGRPEPCCTPAPDTRG